MKKLFSIYLSFLPLFICLLGLSANVQADDSLLEPQVSLLAKDSEGFSAALGLSLISAADYAGSNKYGLSLQLDGALHWSQGNHLWYWEGLDLNDTGLGLRYLKQGAWLLDTGIRHEIVLPTNQTQAAGIDNFPHRGSHVFAFIETKHALNDSGRDWISARASAGPSRYGWLAKTAIGHNFDPAGIDENRSKGNAATAISLFITFANADHLNNYFGISQKDETSSGLSQNTEFRLSLIWFTALLLS